MSEPQFIVLHSFYSAESAHLAQLALQREDILCEVVGDELATSLSWFGSAVIKVDLLVLEKDVEQAQQVLLSEDQQFFARRVDRWGINSCLGWVCDQCNEVNDQSFELCWSCKANRSPDAELQSLDEDSGDVVVGDMPTWSQETDPSPYRPPTATSEISISATDATLSDRTFRAIILSFYFPPLFIYAVYLLWKCFSTQQMTPRLWNCITLAGLLIGIGALLFFLSWRL